VTLILNILKYPKFKEGFFRIKKKVNKNIKKMYSELTIKSMKIKK